MKNFKIPGKIVAIILSVVLVIIGIIKIPRVINSNKLKALGYDDEAITAIINKNVASTILSNSYYSEYLNNEVVKDSFNPKYVKLYVISNHVDDSYINLYEKLKARTQTIDGETIQYSEEDLEKLYSSLSYLELRPLLIFDILKDDEIDTYIKDCDNHPDNTINNYTFTNDYLNMYQNVTEVEDKSSIEVFVSPKTSIGDYVPEKLVEISSMDAISGLYMQSEALDAYTRMNSEMRENGISVYAISAYTPYETYEEIYEDYEKAYGYKGEDYVYSKMGGRPGCNDDQTGLSVKVVSATTNKVSDFNTTQSYAWLVEHAHEYGFIFRYPEGKEVFTGQDAQYSYLRYVGVGLATKIHDSGLSFDEYYYFYMQ